MLYAMCSACATYNQSPYFPTGHKKPETRLCQGTVLSVQGWKIYAITSGGLNRVGGGTITARMHTPSLTHWLFLLPASFSAVPGKRGKNLSPRKSDFSHPTVTDILLWYTYCSKGAWSQQWKEAPGGSCKEVKRTGGWCKPKSCRAATLWSFFQQKERTGNCCALDRICHTE